MQPFLLGGRVVISICSFPNLQQFSLLPLCFICRQLFKLQRGWIFPSPVSNQRRSFSLQKSQENFLNKTSSPLGKRSIGQLAKDVTTIYVICLLSLGQDLTEWRNISFFFPLYYLSALCGHMFQTVSQLTLDQAVNDF